MVAVARRYLAGHCHFSEVLGAAAECAFWAKIQGTHPAIRSLATRWVSLADQVWNEWGLHSQPLPETEFRRRLAADLGEDDVAPDSPSALRAGSPAGA